MYSKIQRAMFYLLIILFLTACGGGNDTEDENKWELVADAGQDRTVIFGSSVKLNGNNSLEKLRNEPILYRWSISQKPEGSNAAPPVPIDAANPLFTPDVAGEYKLQLDISVANSQQIITSYVTITVTEFQQWPMISIDSEESQIVSIDSKVYLNLGNDNTFQADVYYVWQIESAPNDLVKQTITQHIEQNRSAIGSFQPLLFQPTVEGEYRFNIIAQDKTKTIVSQNQIEITVINKKSNSAPPELSIISHANNAYVTSDCPVRLEGTFVNPEADVVKSDITWVSSVDGILGKGESITVTLSPDVHLITLNATDTDGQTSTVNLTLNALTSRLSTDTPVIPGICGDFATDPDTLLEGNLVGPSLQGIRYSTNTISGTTDVNGRFRYRFGETVYFQIGNNLLGSARGSEKLTPIDLVHGAEDETDNRVMNIIRFLQSIDIDDNPDNGISISEGVLTKLENIKFDFSSPVFSFSSALFDFFRSSNESGIFSTPRKLISADLARKNLRWSLFGEVPVVHPLPNTQLEIIADSQVIYDPDRKEKFLDFDPNGFPHIVVGGDHLYHVFETSEGWESEIIGDSTNILAHFRTHSMRVDDQGFIHVTFSATGKYSSSRYYLTNRSGNWATESIEHLDGQLQIDKSGNINLFGFDTNEGKFFHKTNVNGMWTSIFLGDAGSDGPANTPSSVIVKIDKSGNYHVAFIKTTGYSVNFEYTTLNYASNSSGAWKVALLQEDYGTLPSNLIMNIDDNGTPHIGYSDRQVIHGAMYCFPSPCDKKDQVRYFTRTDNTWTSETVVGWDGLVGVSVTNDSNGNLDFYISNGSTLYSANKVEGIWKTDIIATGLLNGSITVGYGPFGKKAISYISEEPQLPTSVKYITQVDKSWESQTVHTVFPTGLFQASVLDSKDKLHVGYWDPKINAIKYATNSNGKWNTETAIDNVEINSRIEIAVDSNYFVHIAFVDSGTNSLKYATNKSGGWITEGVGSTTSVSNSPSLILDANGKPYIAYRDGLLFSLMIAEKISDIWTTERIVYYSSKDYSFDLGVSGSGVKYLCYGVNYGNEKGIQLAYKMPTETSWQVAQINSGDITESYCSLAIDATDNVHLAYRIDLPDIYSDQLVYSNNTSGNWNSEIIPTGNLPGRYVSLTLNSLGKPVITHAESDSKIHYVTKYNDEWVSGLLGDAANSENISYKAPAFMDSLGRLQATYKYGDLKAVMITDPMQD
ncbi:MAG: hypothetical protein OEX07_01095 [Gammaproteobacteria bacterium]|nr:hypothetical protein [Gammaproteobacteria bacterium]